MKKLLTLEIQHGVLEIFEVSGLLTGKKRALIQLRGHCVDADGIPVDRETIRVFLFTGSIESLEAYLATGVDELTIGAITFAFLGGVVEGKEFTPKIAGVERVR